MQSPYALAFLDTTDDLWTILNTIVDCVFLIDIIVNFHSAYYDKEFEMVDDKKTIVRGYLYSWFAIDLLSIVPFD